MNVRGVIFDLDGTLVDSRLDFDLMRREMGLPAGQPLLEGIARLTQSEAARCWAILAEHERRGANRATLLPGADVFVNALCERGIKTAVFTRNSRVSTLATLERLALAALDPIFTRDDAVAKPDPAAIWMICETWGCDPGQCVVIGDYRYDIEAGRNAGARTVLYTGGGGPHGLHDGLQADFVLDSFLDCDALWCWLAAK